MKKSRIAKLALMGASITALAATLTTSTYAWYVSNKVANVNGGTGITGSAESDGSVLLSWTGAEGTWFKTIDFSEDTDAKKDALQPIHLDAADYKFYNIQNGTVEGVKQTVKNTTEVTDKFVQFDVWVQATKCTVTPTITITNTTSSYTDQVAYAGDKYVVVDTNEFTAETSVAAYYTKNGNTYTQASGNYVEGTTYYSKTTENVGLPNGVSQRQSFHVDATQSLYTLQELTATSTITSNSVASGAVARSMVPANTTASTGNAHSYYEAVTGYKVEYGKEPASATGLTPIVFSGADTEAIKVSYKIFLEGGDVDCFNSCENQSFNFALTFTVTA